MTAKWQAAPANLRVQKSEAHVWYCDFSNLRNFADEFHTLSKLEQQRAARFKTEESRLTFVGSHVFLRRVLGGCLGVPPEVVCFSIAEGGKPYLDQSTHGSDLQFSLSHSHGCAACAVISSRAVGVDLERPDPQLCDDDTAKQVFGPEELRYLGECQSEERVAAFFRGWTKKEAYAKCTGTGLSSNLLGLETGFAEGGSLVDSISLFSFQCPNGYVAGLAVEGPSVQVLFWDLPPERLISWQ